MNAQNRLLLQPVFLLGLPFCPVSGYDEEKARRSAMRKRSVFAAGVLILLCLLAGCGQKPQPAPAPEAGAFTLTFITVGKGDAFLLEAPEGRFYLVDTGKDQDYPQIVRALRLKGVDRLEGILLSHGHKDHAGCLEPLLEAFPVGAVYLSGRDNISYTEIDPGAILSGFPDTEQVALTGGETIELGGAQAQVWIPDAVDANNANNNSMVLRVTHGSCSFLLMGDAELEEEAALMASGFPLEADVLKLGHHGETDATSPAFLDRVQPDYALIAGNMEENPDSVNKTMAAELDRRNIAFYYSDGDCLDFISDGSSISVEPLQDRGLPRTEELSFAEVDRKNQAVSIRNDGEKTADLEGCVLISTRGDEIFHFPSGTVLDPGQTLTVVCRDSELAGDLIWEQDSVWKKKRDDALLYDRNMNLLDADHAKQ